ncbi:MAG: hypothetical protein KDE34_15670, partial [Anaerolineales bacterium]|nr:hypothetical protein [Anaerolineales bacterium]
MNPTQLATAVFTTLTPFLAAPAASAAPAAALLAALRARFAQSPDPADAAALARYEQDPTAHQAALQPRLVALLHADPA